MTHTPQPGDERGLPCSPELHGFLQECAGEWVNGYPTVPTDSGSWKSKIMPDDAPELEGTLVGGILQREQQAHRHREAHAAALAVIRHLIGDRTSRRRIGL